MLGADVEDGFAHSNFTRADMMALLYAIEASGCLPAPQGLVTSSDCAAPGGIGSARVDWDLVPGARGCEAHFGDLRTITVLGGRFHHVFVLDVGTYTLSARATNTARTSGWATARVTIEECDHITDTSMR